MIDKLAAMAQRFVILSDTHFLAPQPNVADKTWWNRVLEAECGEIGAALVRAVRRLEPDFVVHCGDLTGHCDMANYEFGAAVMDRLQCPWYVVPGNHDTWFPGVRAALAARYGLPGHQCHYARDLAGLRFLFLDMSYWASRDGRIMPYLDQDLYDGGQIAGMGASPEGLDWLERELATADRPVVVVSHAPLGYKPDYAVATLPHGKPPAGPRTSVVGIMGDVVGREGVRALLRRHPRVRLALAGHWHICDLTREDGVAFCQTPALREYPFEFRLAIVEGGHVRVTTHGLGDETFRRQSYVETWGNAWVAGTEADRTFTVAL